MMIEVKTTWTNNNPNTIYNKLAKRLGRKPTHRELVAELHRIMSEMRERKTK